MVLVGPGRFILYQQASSLQPAWPAIVCSDDMAPKEVHEQRPRGYNTLILLMETFEFTWALAGDMQEYYPSYSPEMENTNQQLKEACDLALNSILDGLDLDHWRAVMRERNNLEKSSSSGQTVDFGSNASLDLNLDPDLEAAIRLSLAEEQKKGSSSSRRPKSASMPGSYENSESDMETEPGYQNIIQPSFAKTSRRKRQPSPHCLKLVQKSAKHHRLTSARDHDSRSGGIEKPTQFVGSRTPLDWVGRSPSRNVVREDPDNTMPSIYCDYEPLSNNGKKHPTVQNNTKRPSRQPLLSNEYFIRSTNPSNSKRRSSLLAANDQFPDAEVEDHEGFVDFIVGPEHETFHVLKSEVDRRKYFANNSLGANCMIKAGRNKWSFQRPCLQTIDPEDFKPVAEYLSTGGFGHRVIEDAEQKGKALIDCCSAWRVADALVMDDLLDYIVGKMERLRPWGLVETLAFAEVVYEMEGAPLPAYRRMKNVLSDLVAANYLEYLRDYPTAFGEHMVRIPEFLDDVHRARGKILERMPKPSQRHDSVTNLERGYADAAIPPLEVDQAHEAANLNEKQNASFSGVCRP